ncbi:hypothetical protein [Albimonas pacifica]|uniref:Uncharacterized protein n=1 Tax=Albimonas pacifica TaxID=1114924 RepID=A0A1I3FV92_9RHOB|nr:hypothetical protein [Albimonas pacifica]SFI15119.1 hypothetical protein SAMN05216258_104539 [Albimonas pacifica]
MIDPFKTGTPRDRLNALVERSATVILHGTKFGGMPREDVICDIAAAGRDEIARLEKEIEALLEAGNKMSIAAQTTGGVAGRDEGLCEAVAGWAALSPGGADESGEAGE